MRFLLNVIWLVFGGFWLALGYVLAGIVACILIVTIPFGIASFRMAGYALWPFGRAVIPKPGAGVGSALGNVIWFLVAGILWIGGALTSGGAQTAWWLAAAVVELEAQMAIQGRAAALLH